MKKIAIGFGVMILALSVIYIVGNEANQLVHWIDPGYIIATSPIFTGLLVILILLGLVVAAYMIGNIIAGD